MNKLIDTKMLRYASTADEIGFMEIDEEHIHDNDGYSTTDIKESLGLKPVGRVYFFEYENLDYRDGGAVEKPVITGGEVGMINRYLKPGVKVYTEEMVINIVKSRLYENNEELKPKLPKDVAEFLNEIEKNTGKNKPKRAKELLNKYSVVGSGEDDTKHTYGLE